MHESNCSEGGALGLLSIKLSENIAALSIPCLKPMEELPSIAADACKTSGKTFKRAARSMDLKSCRRNTQGILWVRLNPHPGLILQPKAAHVPLEDLALGHGEGTRAPLILNLLQCFRYQGLGLKQRPVPLVPLFSI
jgi:hypothetical protein